MHGGDVDNTRLLHNVTEPCLVLPKLAFIWCCQKMDLNHSSAYKIVLELRIVLILTGRVINFHSIHLNTSIQTALCIIADFLQWKYKFVKISLSLNFSDVAI